MVSAKKKKKKKKKLVATSAIPGEALSLGLQVMTKDRRKTFIFATHV
jgi:hypothetical protein